MHPAAIRLPIIFRFMRSRWRLPAGKDLLEGTQQLARSLTVPTNPATCKMLNCGDEPMEETEIYPIIGEEGFTRLVAAFYRQVPHDDILGAMYPRDELQNAEQ